MADLASTADIKNAVLKACGELTNGTSTYEDTVMEYINKLYKGLLAGGNEFGIDVDFNWRWARCPRPILLALKPNYKEGTVTVTKNDVNASFSDPPSDSMQGRWIRFTNKSDMFRIAYHVGGDANFQLDMPYTEDSGTYNYRAMKLEYELVDDSIIITDRCNNLYFKDGTGTLLTAALDNGVYTPAELVAEINTKVDALTTDTITCSYESLIRKFKFTSNGSSFSLIYATSTKPWTNVMPTIGFYATDYTGELTYTSPAPLNGIQRLFSPMTIYRNQGLYIATSARDLGKIFGVSYEALLTSWPMAQITGTVPERFAVVEYREDGTAVVRFNEYVEEEMRVECEYIQLATSLQDNEASVPLIPQAYRDYLVYGATFYLMMDKSDNKAETFSNLARAKLQALINNERSETAKTAQFAGKLLPRQGDGRGLRRFWLWGGSY